MLVRHAKTSENLDQTLLQNVIKKIEEKLQDKMAEVDEITKYGEKALAEEDVQTQKNIVYRNKRKLNAISANPVERVIYKAGLGSPTLLKKKNNMERQKLHEQRRISDNVSRVSNHLATGNASSLTAKTG